QQCVTNMLGQAQQLGCPDAADVTCVCINPDFGFGIRDCTNESCPPNADNGSVTDFGAAFCAPTESSSTGTTNDESANGLTSTQSPENTQRATATSSEPISNATPTSATGPPQQPSEDGLSKASKAGIGIGVAITIIVACGVFYWLYKRRQARRTHPIHDDSADDYHEPDKEAAKHLDAPPAYPYEKATNFQGGSGSNSSQGRSYLSKTQSSEDSGAGFYARSSKQERSHEIQQDSDIISYHNRPEIDGIPLHEAPESSKQYDEKTIGDITGSKPSSPSLIQGGPGYVDYDHLSKLEQEERQLQEDIAQIERLERLKVERDRVRKRIREMSGQPRRESA
ncbi:MAG: hypothetical protein Q9204_007872, partial [Flavoplaca sp. TL-2023a]